MKELLHGSESQEWDRVAGQHKADSDDLVSSFCFVIDGWHKAFLWRRKIELLLGSLLLCGLEFDLI